MKTLRIGSQLLELERPLVMGILNLTNDSFYDGGRFLNHSAALDHVDKMLSDGADIIDIGAFSSRPGAELVSESKQIDTIGPIMEAVLKQFPDVKLSIDTCHSLVVEELAKLGSFIVNDISGGQWDPHLFDTVAKAGLPYVLMHILGTPKTMQNSPSYEDVAMDVLTYLASKLHVLRQKGISDVIIDPGFGFGKTISHNYKLLAKLEVFKILDCPVMVGLSRKSMIYKTLGIKPDAALNGTTALHMTSLMNGAKILRVHDVQEAKETRTLWKQLSISC